ncbi:MAG TPA: hypothetical protein DGR27_05210 [Eubacterium sp.]|nr:MAG TPA: hypothetical protein [Caudoviricetes sp.]HAS70604.1 hypothetical protein [Eubacterium sp.]HCW37899.1 hypothetical protein [Eubacterium sp.]
MIKCDKGRVEAEGQVISILAEYYTLTIALYKNLKENTDEEYAKMIMDKTYNAAIDYCNIVKDENDSDMLNNFIEKTGEDICRKL